MIRRTARRFLAAAAAGVAAALALRERGAGHDPLEALAGAWAGIASGPGGRKVEVALAVARRGRRGLFGPQAFEVALRTLEDVGGKPLERSTSGDDLLARARFVARRAAGTVVVESRSLRVEYDPARPAEVRLQATRYWGTPALDLDVVLARALEVGS